MSNYTSQYRDFDPSTDRTIFLTGGITEQTCDEVIQKIIAIDEYDSSMEVDIMEKGLDLLAIESEHEVMVYPKYERIPIRLVVNSFGGEAWSCLALVNTMNAITTEVHTEAVGKVMSSGFLIFINGDQRFGYTNTAYLWHDLQIEKWGTLNKVKDSVKISEELNSRIEKIILEKTLLSQEQLDEMKSHNRDWVMFGEEALENGVVDYLIDKPFEEDPEYQSYDIDCGKECNCDECDCDEK